MKTFNYLTAIFILLIFMSPSTAVAERPNILFITFDALGAKYLPFYGFEKNTAPNLNHFANECYLFSDAVSQSGTTSFSLGSIFTSRYPFADNLMRDKVIVKKTKLFLPYILQKNGYHTFAIVRDQFAKSRYGFDHGFDHFDEEYIFSDAKETFQSAIDLLKNQAREPFFLWIHNEEPHSPYLPPEQYFRDFYHHPSLPTVYSFLDPSIVKHYEFFKKEYRQYHQDMLDASAGSGRYFLYGQERELGTEELKQLRARYFGNIKYADAHFGKLLHFLKSQAFFKNTVIIISADHGESLGSHNLFDHNDVYQDIIHVPLLVHLPGQSYKKTIKRPVQLVDIYPTIMDLAGLKTQYPLRGKNLFNAHGRRYRISENQGKKAVITPTTKYICERWLFYSYNLTRDPGEREKIKESLLQKDSICKIPPLPDNIFIPLDETASVEKSDNVPKKPMPLPPQKQIKIGSTSLNEFTLTNCFELTGKDIYTFEKGARRLKIEVIKNLQAETAQSEIDKENTQIRALFKNTFSPYPEELTHQIECPDKFMPVYYKSKKMRQHLITYSNKRLGIGICSEDLIQYRYLVGWIYCSQNKELHKIRYYVPQNTSDRELTDFFNELACKPRIN